MINLGALSQEEQHILLVAAMMALGNGDSANPIHMETGFPIQWVDELYEKLRVLYPEQDTQAYEAAERLANGTDDSVDEVDEVFNPTRAGLPSFEIGQTVYAFESIFAHSVVGGGWLPHHPVIKKGDAVTVVGYWDDNQWTSTPHPLCVQVHISDNQPNLIVFENVLTAHLEPTEGFDPHIDELIAKGDELTDDDRRYLGRAVGIDYDSGEMANE